MCLSFFLVEGVSKENFPSLLLFSFCDELRPVISGTIFVQLLVVGLVLGFTIINIVLFANFSSRIAALFFMTAVLLETTPFCILCNFLADDCIKCSDALFESNWIDQEPRYKKTLLQFLQSLQQPIVFMAGNVFTISVATNISVRTYNFPTSLYPLIFPKPHLISSCRPPNSRSQFSRLSSK